MPVAVTLTNRQVLNLKWVEAEDCLKDIMNLIGHTEEESGIPDAEAQRAFTAINAALEALENGRPRSR